MTQPDSNERTAEQTWVKAKAYCFDLLAVRARSTDELRQALHRKGYDAALSEELLRKLDESGLVDDTEFAENWTRARHNSQGLGKKAIRAELKRKGIAAETAEAAVAEIAASDEEQRARELVRKRLPAMSGLEERTVIRRLLGMLGRKGYSRGLAHHVIREELADTDRDTALLEDETPD